jgi:hypothetical protein
MTIEILIFDGCPNSESAEKLVRETLSELGIDAKIEIINVIDNDDAIAKRFLGSPSIRIDGKDLEIGENFHTQYSMRCRLYRSGQEISGVPNKDVLTDCLRNPAKG